MNFGSDPFFTSSFEEDNNDFWARERRERWCDGCDEPQVSVVGRISRGRDGEQDQVTLYPED